MSCVSLYDLKHHILNRRCLNNDALPSSTNSSKSLSSPLATSSLPTKSQVQQSSMSSILNRISRSKATPNLKSTTVQPNISIKSTPIAEALKSPDTIENPKLFKNAFYTIDFEAEPLWTPFLPSERVLDYHILFALTNCNESDPPICVYNSDGKNTFLL